MLFGMGMAWASAQQIIYRCNKSFVAALVPDLFAYGHICNLGRDIACVCFRSYVYLNSLPQN